MPISLVYGLPGRNKTHFATYYAIALAEKYHKKLVFNYILHPDKLYQYCLDMRYSWVCSSLQAGNFLYFCDLEKEKSIEHFLTISDSIVVCDEAAGYFPARGSVSNTPKKFIKDLTQVRHRKQYFICICQDQLQIDTAIKTLAEEILQCNGITLYDSQLGTQKLVFKIVRRFDSYKFASWSSNPRLKGNPLKTHLMANKSWLSPLLSIADYKLFEVYNSFNLVHESLFFADSAINYIVPKQSVTVHGGAFASPRTITDASEALRIAAAPSISSSSPVSHSYFAYLPPLPSRPLSSKIRHLLFKYAPGDSLLVYRKLCILFLRFPGSSIDYSSSSHRFILWILFFLFLFLFLDFLSVLRFLR